MLSSTVPRQSLHSSRVRNIKRYVPAPAQKSFRGKVFMTNAQGRDFLLRNNLEPDNGKMPVFAPNNSVKKLTNTASISLGFSPSYFIHPFDLIYFDAKGHPLAAMTRSRYMRKIRDESLWLMMTSVTVQSPVVRNVARSRLIIALHEHLKARGYTLAPGRGPDREIRGTLWIINHNPAVSLNISADDFGSEIAQALDKAHGRQII
ncbi:hypothetical protein CDD81_5032 [Ophiocordyceps australis]|uniref:Uncharacterized protein n=1 Tax=Ophiocordyceps australis TaxID=1399860 RepID=A0A2C5XA64_9HYPO|nr:hypothetical protein CDD81_5032 [Ophiocordyceps australis]